jgi:hypothetical protein
MLPVLQPGLTRTSLHDDRLGQILDGLFAANLNRRIRRRSPSMELMRRSPTGANGQSRLVLLMGTAKMGMMISSKCS